MTTDVIETITETSKTKTINTQNTHQQNAAHMISITINVDIDEIELI